MFSQSSTVLVNSFIVKYPGMNNIKLILVIARVLISSRKVVTIKIFN